MSASKDNMEFDKSIIHTTFLRRQNSTQNWGLVLKKDSSGRLLVHSVAESSKLLGSSSLQAGSFIYSGNGIVFSILPFDFITKYFQENNEIHLKFFNPISSSKISHVSNDAQPSAPALFHQNRNIINNVAQSSRTPDVSAASTVGVPINIVIPSIPNSSSSHANTGNSKSLTASGASKSSNVSMQRRSIDEVIVLDDSDEEPIRRSSAVNSQNKQGQPVQRTPLSRELLDLMNRSEDIEVIDLTSDNEDSGISSSRHINQSQGTSSLNRQSIQQRDVHLSNSQRVVAQTSNPIAGVKRSLPEGNETAKGSSIKKLKVKLEFEPKNFGEANIAGMPYSELNIHPKYCHSQHCHGF